MRDKFSEIFKNINIPSREEINRDTTIERNKLMAKDPKWKEALVKSRDGLKDKDSEWYKNVKKANQKRAKLQTTPGTPEYEAYMQGREKVKNNTNHKINVAKAKEGSPCDTPWGAFWGVNEASKQSQHLPDWEPVFVPWGQFVNEAEALKDKGNRQKLSRKQINNRIKNPEYSDFYRLPDIEQNKCKHSPKQIKLRCNKNAPGFRWITWEEYEQKVDKDQ